MKKFKIAWLYYDLLDLYGDKGNVKVLEDILNSNNIEYEIDKITLNDDRVLSNYDLLFLGGGTDKVQNIVASDLIKRKKELLNIMKNKGYIIAVCGGYQMFGKYYLDTQNNKIPGLNIYDFYTEAGKNRSVGNIKIEVKYEDTQDGYEVVGFENHSGETKGVGKNYFGKVIKGNGNEYKSEYEGYRSHNFLGTYIHGPLLPKNPLIAKSIIEQILFEKYNKKIELKLKFLNDIEKAKKNIKYDK